MAIDTAKAGPAPPPGGWRLFGRRTVPVLFTAGILAAASLAATVPAFAQDAEPMVRFSHAYPADPVSFNVPAPTGPVPSAPLRYSVAGRRVVTSFAQLARLLHRGVLRRLGQGWLLMKPTAVLGRAVLRIHGGPGLSVAPGAFLLAAQGGTISLRGVTITGVGRDRRPMLRADRGRGFLAAEGGALWLDRVHLAHLGYLGTHAFGLMFSSPLPNSGVVHSTLEDLYRGVYTTKAAGVRIVDNVITHSVEYGIDPHTQSTGLTIDGNRVEASGLHGIILAVDVQRSSVRHNVVVGAGDHGIVLFDNSNSNAVVGNVVRATFDGIVLMNSSYNMVAGNVVGPVARFGLRVSGPSRENSFVSNRLSSRILAGYLYGGATANRLEDNRFEGERENLRITAAAPGNHVSPIPARSEVAP